MPFMPAFMPVEAYPQLQPDDIRAALSFAAEMTRQRIIPLPSEPVES